MPVSNIGPLKIRGIFFFGSEVPWFFCSQKFHLCLSTTAPVEAVAANEPWPWCCSSRAWTHNDGCSCRKAKGTVSM